MKPGSGAPMCAAMTDQQARNWEALPHDIVQVLGSSYLGPTDVAAARYVSRSWCHSFSTTVRHLHLSLNPHTSAPPAAGGGGGGRAADAAAAEAAGPGGAGGALEVVAATVQRLQAAFPGVSHIHLHVAGKQNSQHTHTAALTTTSSSSSTTTTTKAASSMSQPQRSTCGDAVRHWVSPQPGQPVTPPQVAQRWPRLHASSPGAAAAAAAPGAAPAPTTNPNSSTSSCAIVVPVASRGSWRVSPDRSSSSSSGSSSPDRSSGSSSGSSSSGSGGSGGGGSGGGGEGWAASPDPPTSCSSCVHNHSSGNSSSSRISSRGPVCVSPTPTSSSHQPGFNWFGCPAHHHQQQQQQQQQQAGGLALVGALLGELVRLPCLRSLVLTADANVGELPVSPLTRLTQVTQLVLLASYPPQLLPKLTASLTRLRHLHLGTSDALGASGATTWLPASPASVTGVTSGGCVGVAHTRAQLSSLSQLSNSLQRLVLVEAPGTELGPALPPIAALTRLTSLVLLPPGRGQGMLWRGLTPADLASLSALVNLRELTVPAVIYDSTMTYIHHVPRLAAAYDAALTKALTGMTGLTRMRYILGCTPTDALLAPLAAAGGLVVLVVEAALTQEAVSRRQLPWRDDTPPLTAQGLAWMSRLSALHLALPTWPGGLGRLAPLLASPGCVGVTLGPCPQVAEGTVLPLSAASGLQRLVFQRVAFPTLSDEGALLASRALSQLLLTLPCLRVLALHLVEGEWAGGALVTDEVLMALRCTAKGLQEVVYEVAAVQKRSPWWAGGGSHVVSAAQLSEVGLAALLTHPSVTSVTLACPVTLRQPRWYRPPNQAAVRMAISTGGHSNSSGSSSATPTGAVPSSGGGSSSSSVGRPGQAAAPATATSTGSSRSSPQLTTQSTSQLKRLTLCLAVEPLSPAAAAAAAYLYQLQCPAAGAAYKRAWRHREASPGAVMRYRFPAESTLLEQLPASLTHLTLQLPGLKDAYLTQLATRCPQLQQLTLYVASGACQATSSTIPTTTSSTSSGTGVTLEGLRHLAAVTPHLEQLVLLLPPHLASLTLQQHPAWLQQLCTNGCQEAIGRSTFNPVVNPVSGTASSSSSRVPLPAGIAQRSGPRLQLLQLMGDPGEARRHSSSSSSGGGGGRLAWDGSGQTVKLDGGGCGVVYLAKGSSAVMDVTQLLQQQYQDLQAATTQQQQQQQQRDSTLPEVEPCWEPDAWPRSFSQDQSRCKETGIFTWVPPGVSDTTTQEEGVALPNLHSSSSATTTTTTTSSSSSSRDKGVTRVGAQQEGKDSSCLGVTDHPALCSTPDRGDSCNSTSTGPLLGSSTAGSSRGGREGGSSSSPGVRSAPRWAWLAGKPGWQHLVPSGDWGDSAAGDVGDADHNHDERVSSWVSHGRPGDGQRHTQHQPPCLTAFLGDYVAEDCGISSADTSECCGHDL